MSRYDERIIFDNTNPLYAEKRRKIGKRAIKQYASAPLRDLSEEQIQNLVIEAYTWKQGDKFHKIAELYYGDAKLWWVIAQYNFTPTEAYVSLGDEIYIPQPIERILQYYGL